MKAVRTVPARPVNNGEIVTGKIIELVAAALDKSPHLDAGSIRDELQKANAAFALLASGGHLRRGELVLVAPGLRLQIDVPVGERALTAEENTDPPRGAGTAEDWTVHVPAPESLAGVVHAAVRSCPHVSAEAAPDDAPDVPARSAAKTIDLSRLAAGGGGP